jgi:hypothetical protein
MRRKSKAYGLSKFFKLQRKCLFLLASKKKNFKTNLKIINLLEFSTVIFFSQGTFGA